MHNYTQNPNSPENSVTPTKGSEIKTGAYQDQQITNKAETSGQAPNKQKLQSVFNLVKSIKGKQAIICTALTGEQATSFVNALGNELNSPLLIKFTGMEGIR